MEYVRALSSKFMAVKPFVSADVVVSLLISPDEFLTCPAWFPPLIVAGIALDPRQWSAYPDLLFGQVSADAKAREPVVGTYTYPQQIPLLLEGGKKEAKRPDLDDNGDNVSSLSESCLCPCRVASMCCSVARTPVLSDPTTQLVL